MTTSIKTIGISVGIGLLLGAGLLYILTRTPSVDLAGFAAREKQEVALREDLQKQLTAQREVTAKAETAAKQADADLEAEKKRVEILLANTQQNVDRIHEVLKKKDVEFEAQITAIGGDIDPCIRVREQCERAKRELKGIRFPPSACQCESAGAGK